MKYNVEYSESAQRDLEEATNFIALDSVENALRWFDAYAKLIDALELIPHAHPPAREAEEFDLELRQIVYKSHRAIYSIEGRTVKIHRVVHTAQDDLHSLE